MERSQVEKHPEEGQLGEAPQEKNTGLRHERCFGPRTTRVAVIVSRRGGCNCVCVCEPGVSGEHQCFGVNGGFLFGGAETLRLPKLYCRVPRVSSGLTLTPCVGYYFCKFTCEQSCREKFLRCYI